MIVNALRWTSNVIWDSNVILQDHVKETKKMPFRQLLKTVVDITKYLRATERFQETRVLVANCTTPSKLLALAAGVCSVSRP